jgi:ABC-2 type transport system permease protein
MNLQASWAIATKEFKIFRRKKTIIYGTILFPLLLAILFPLVVVYAGGKSAGGIPPDALPPLMNAFSFFYVIAAGILPNAIATYAIVGEKVEKSLEPLLATPTTDGEVLLGKGIAAFIPPMIATWVGASIYMVLMDRVTFGKLSYLYYPNLSIGIVLLVLAPLAAILSIEISVLASSRVSDVRAANSIGGLMFIPFMIIYLASEIGVIYLNNSNLLIISGAFLVVDVALSYFSVATFHREEILTKWK